jgi:hypothetical protein
MTLLQTFLPGIIQKLTQFISVSFIAYTTWQY